MIFILFIFIFNRINAFVVDDYAGAVAFSANKLNSLNDLKDHTALIEITYKNNTKQLVYGYVLDDAFFILTSYLLDKNLFSVKQIKYLYHHKIIMERVRVVNKLLKAKIVTGILLSDISDSTNKSLSDFADYFMGDHKIDDLVFQVPHKKKFLIHSHNFSEVNHELKQNNWGLRIEDFIDPFKDTKSVEFYPSFMNVTSWYIIGKPNGESVEEIEPISLKYISDSIDLLAIKLNERSQRKFLMGINGIKFQQYDLGAFLVNCKFIFSTINKECKFFGQINKIFKINEHRQTIVVESVLTHLFLKADKFNFQPQIVDPSMKEYEPHIGDFPITTKSSRQTSETTSKIISSDDKESKVLEGELYLKGQKHKSEHDSMEGLGDESSFSKKKSKLNPAQNQISLGQYSCNQLNILGEHKLNPSLSIIVDEIEISNSSAEIIGKYYIKGTYIEKGEKFQFNLCYKSGEVYYLTQESEPYQ